jgi:diaminopimelate decarboxylase
MSSAGTAGTQPRHAPARGPDAAAPPGRNEILREGRLGNHDPAELAERFGTPFFAYDLDVVARQVTALRDVLPPAFDLAYAVKANPSLAIIRHLGRLGLGADVASGGELGHVRRAGIAPDRIVFTGPGKRDVELAAAVEAGVRAVTVESPGELRRLARIAEGLGRRQPVLLRAAVAEPVHAGRVQLLGDEVTGKFGMDDADLRVAAAEAVASPWLDPLGLHAFGVSNELDAAVLAAHLDATIARARDLAQTAGFPLRLVDVGGGLGYPYGEAEAELDVRRLGSRLAAAAAALARTPSTRQARVVVEPGRFLVAAAGAYVARVVDRKTIRGRHVVILDGGIHHLLRHLLVGQENRVRALTGSATIADGAAPAGRGATAHDGPVAITIGGPLCTGLDVIARAAVMTPPDVGDLIAVLDVGAYGATESMPFFLSHPLPAELGLRGGDVWVARPRIEPETWLAWQEAAPVG